MEFLMFYEKDLDLGSVYVSRGAMNVKKYEFRKLKF